MNQNKSIKITSTILTQASASIMLMFLKRKECSQSRQNILQDYLRIKSEVSL